MPILGEAVSCSLVPLVGCPVAATMFVPVLSETALCKCCGNAAVRTGEVDFHKSCEDHRGAPLAPSGVPIAYHRCPRCGFLFTIALDHLTHEGFIEHVYNDEYALVDPDFVTLRPTQNAKTVAEVFAGSPQLRVLDYGGGNGSMAAMLRTHGFAGARSYDPFYASEGAQPKGAFDLVTAFEVLEHTPSPIDTLREMRSFVAEGGMMFFTTLLQPADIDTLGLAWWYAAPRNGHVSLYSRESMTSLMKQIGFKWESFSDTMHIAYRSSRPKFARHLRATDRS